MTREQTFEAAWAFFSRALKLDASHARLSLVSAGANFHRAVVAVDFGVRRFEVEINRPGNTIRLSEIVTRKRLRFDPRNPLNGYAMREEQEKRTLRTGRLDSYCQPEKKDRKSAIIL